MFEDIEQRGFHQSKHSPHIKIINYIPENSSVLDVGCSSGYIDKKLKDKNCSIVGIEVDRDSAKQAEAYCEKVIVADVEAIKDLPYPENSFDVIIFSDILEHLRRPDLVLVNFKRYLKSEGFVIASIPNIARLEYRIRHLLGNFDYEPHGGIISRTHLRFFTLKTAKMLFSEAGYGIVKVDYTGLASRIKIFPKMTAFQFIIIVKK